MAPTIRVAGCPFTRSRLPPRETATGGYFNRSVRSRCRAQRRGARGCRRPARRLPDFLGNLFPPACAPDLDHPPPNDTIGSGAQPRDHPAHAQSPSGVLAGREQPPWAAEGMATSGEALEPTVPAGTRPDRGALEWSARSKSSGCRTRRGGPGHAPRRCGRTAPARRGSAVLAPSVRLHRRSCA
jgi:hypothetical protein